MPGGGATAWNRGGETDTVDDHADDRGGFAGDDEVVLARVGGEDLVGEDAMPGPAAIGEGRTAAFEPVAQRVDDAAELQAVRVHVAAGFKHSVHREFEVVFVGSPGGVEGVVLDDGAVDVAGVGDDQVHGGSLSSSKTVKSKPNPRHSTGLSPGGMGWKM